LELAECGLMKVKAPVDEEACEKLEDVYEDAKAKGAAKTASKSAN